jgi:hypothetical protein
MASPKWAVVWGVLVVWFGVLMLLESINSIQVNPYLWVGLFLLGGLAFAIGYAESAARWWSAILAGFMLGLAAMILWNHVGEGPPDRWGTAIFFGGIGLGFLVVRARTPAHWWASLPGGFALTLGVFIGLTSAVEQSTALAVFFFGIAVTFVVLATEPKVGRGLLRWPLLPAIVAGGLGVAFALDAARSLEGLDVLWSLALIAGGVYILYRAIARYRHTPTL